MVALGSADPTSLPTVPTESAGRPSRFRGRGPPSSSDAARFISAPRTPAESQVTHPEDPGCGNSLWLFVKDCSTWPWPFELSRVCTALQYVCNPSGCASLKELLVIVEPLRQLIWKAVAAMAARGSNYSCRQSCLVLFFRWSSQRHH